MNGLRGKPSLESLLGLLLEHTLIMLRRLIWLAELKHATRPVSRRFLVRDYGQCLVSQSRSSPCSSQAQARESKSRGMNGLPSEESTTNAMKRLAKNCEQSGSSSRKRCQEYKEPSSLVDLASQGVRDGSLAD